MARLFLNSIIITFLSFLFAVTIHAGGVVTILEPVTQSTVSSPVMVCLAVDGLEVEPSKNGVNTGKGHHHLIINSDLPEDLSQPIGHDLRHIHMGDGSSCKELKMAPGKHIIKALFATGNHIPYNPVVSTTVFITVK